MKIDLKRFLNLILAFLLLPLLFININSFHNWGDDFAQYLCQARDIIERNSNLHLPILDSQNIGPINKGSGFSLLLSPIYFLFGSSIAVYLIFISLTLISAGFSIFYFFRSNVKIFHNDLASLLLVMIFVYNRHVLFLKTEILPVFLFTSFLYLGFTLHNKKNMRAVLVLAMVIGFMISTANVGWVYYLSVVTFKFIQLKKDGFVIGFKNFLVLLFIPIIVYLLLKYLVFKTVFTDDIVWYQHLVSIDSLTKVIGENLNYYKDVLLLFFDQNIWFIFNKIIKLVFVVTFCLGIFNKIYKCFFVEDLFFIFYLLLLLIYPDRGSGLRFLIPIIPMILLYSTFGFKLIIEMITKDYQNIALVFYIIVFLSYFQNIKATVSSYSINEDGPFENESIAVFKYIRDSTEKNSCIAFFKPWAIKLFAERSSIPINIKQNTEVIKSTLRKHHVDYLLLNTKQTPAEIYHAEAITAIQSDQNFECLYANSHFKLYRFYR